MFKNFFLKKMIESQLKNVPADQREKILKIVTENPELFVKIAQEIKTKVDSGKTQESAMMEVMTDHQYELKNILKS